ncbi:polyprenyl diphosphate synthase [Nocardioides sp. YIM 152315]|uniref:polyprenyl diphosphate synthase n=1 Tax=Nocardioides sp. YIM 152315 TaxID=3031760 RepID=UPI0023DA7866|nr:polyprenyl diphosphate synthase [Nocardioides sp. YIM 152315]MDF1606009.1 polyprenyl diphosphate synthase [Nocardioides sp. YIM 152315]
MLDDRRPRHLGLIMDGNRRWARAAGYDVLRGHRAGAEHLGEFLGWLEARAIEHATVYVLSADNIRKRAGAEIDHLFHLVETVLPQQVREAGCWRLHVSGDRRLLPVPARAALDSAVAATADRPRHLTLAIGYDPRGDIVAGVRAALASGAEDVDGDRLVAAITEGLPGGPVKEIDLVIRTSGEQRISGFFPWQAQHAEIHVSPRMWPAFTEGDLDLALADYAARRGALG